MAELRERGRSNLACLGLARAELAHVRHRGRRRADGLRVPTLNSGSLTESGVGSSTMTMLSQNAARTRNHMTLPRVFHDVFIPVADTLAESIEGEVGPVLWIFRMFEANLQRVFLKI